MDLSGSERNGGSVGSPEGLFHGRFIPDDPAESPLPLRLVVGVGIALVIGVLAMLCLNVLNSWGVWVTLLIISVLCASGLVVWLWDLNRDKDEDFEEQPAQ
jgi:hypothetical protein